MMGWLLHVRKVTAAVWHWKFLDSEFSFYQR